MDEAQQGNGGVGPANARPNAKSGKIDAIKKSQQKQDRFVNKSLMEDNNE